MKNNFITKIIGATLAFAMMIGGAVGINAAKEAKEVNAATTTYSAKTYSGGNITGTGVTWTGNGVGGSSYVVLKSGASLTSNGFTGIDLSQNVSFTIKTRTYGGSSYKTSTVRAYSDAQFSNDITGTAATVNASGSSFANQNANLSFANNASASTVYFKITSSTTSSSNGPGINEISFTYTQDSGAPEKTSTTTTISAPNNDTTLDVTASPADTIQLSVEVAYDNGTIDDPTIQWSSSSPNIATVSATGLVTAVAKGKTTITAVYAGDSTYNGSNDTIEIDVINPNEAVFDFAALGASNSWTDGNSYSPVVVNGTTITVNNDNNGKYYSSTWRMYNGGSLTITPPSGKSISAISSNPTHAFNIVSGGASASATFNDTVKFKSITVTLDVEKILDTITASVTNTSRVWRTNDVVSASDLTVIPHYTDGTDGAAITDGTGVTVTNGTLQNVGSNTVNVSFGGKSTTVTVNALSSSIVEWTITGEIGETVKSTAYNLSGLTLHGWYDNGKTDEASSSVVSAYGLVANPAVAGSTPDENNTIEVKVYANSDTGHTNCLKTFENVAAPIIIAARGSEQNPYTVAQARAAIDAGTGVNGVYVTGIVSEIVEPYTTQYKNISYNISADGLTTSDQLEAFRGKSYGGNDFASADDIEIGAVVVVYGNLIKYNSTYELAQNNQLVSYMAPVRTLESIAISGTYPTEFLTGDAFSADGMIVTATYDNGSQRIVTNDATFTGYNMSEAGQQTVTVSYEENDVTKTATYNITVTFVDRIPYNLYQEDTVAEGDYIVYYNGYSLKNTISNNRANNDSVTVVNDVISNYLTTNIWHIEYDGEYYTIYNAGIGKYIASNGTNNQVKFEDEVTDNSRWTCTKTENEATYDFVNKKTSRYLRNNGTNGWACYSSSTGGEINLYKRDSLSYLDSASFSSEAKLIANETGEGVDSVAIRFTTKVSKYIWDSIVTDKGVDEFGIMLFKTRNGTHLSAEEKFNAEVDPNNPTTVVAINNTAFGLTLDDNDTYYSFNVKVNIAGPSSYDLKFCASPYVVVDGTHYFLGNMDPSVNSLAQAGALESTLSPEALAILAGN